VLDLIEGKMGLMDLIDEACRFPTATPRDLADKLLGGAVPAASPRFSRAKKSGTAFTIGHYAGAFDLFICGCRAALLVLSSTQLKPLCPPARPTPLAYPPLTSPARPPPDTHPRTNQAR
jgi:hypothetical protein